MPTMTAILLSDDCGTIAVCLYAVQFPYVNSTPVASSGLHSDQLYKLEFLPPKNGLLAAILQISCSSAT